MTARGQQRAERKSRESLGSPPTPPPNPALSGDPAATNTNSKKFSKLCPPKQLLLVPGTRARVTHLSCSQRTIFSSFSTPGENWQPLCGFKKKKKLEGQLNLYGPQNVPNADINNVPHFYPICFLATEVWGFLFFCFVFCFLCALAEQK